MQTGESGGIDTGVTVHLSPLSNRMCADPKFGSAFADNQSLFLR